MVLKEKKKKFNLNNFKLKKIKKNIYVFIEILKFNSNRIKVLF